MRTASIISALFLGTVAQAQVVNGSFEENGTFSLQGWEWTCDEPQPAMDAPTGGGTWSASKQSAHAKGCFPNYLYQRLTTVQNGDIVTLSGWGRCSTEFQNTCLGAYFGLGTVNNGMFQLEENVVVSDTTWTFASITDTIQISTGDTALIVLNAGLIGGPINPTPSLFDEISLSVHTGISEITEEELHVLQIDNGTTLMISAGTARMIAISCYDLTGQQLPIIGERSGSGHALHIEGLTTGLYIIRATTESGYLTAKFVKR